MNRLDLPEAFRALPNRIQGAGVEVCLLDSAAEQKMNSILNLKLHTLIIVLDGPITVNCNGNRETLQKSEAIMMKKNCQLEFEIRDEVRTSFRCLLIFFDEPSLRYALLPFELSPDSSSQSFLKIPLNDKIQVFTDSILLYYKSLQVEQNWTMLLQSKLRELIWIFFHTEIKDQATLFFSPSKTA
jgi:hypothetical protein